MAVKQKTGQKSGSSGKLFAGDSPGKESAAGVQSGAGATKHPQGQHEVCSMCLGGQNVPYIVACQRLMFISSFLSGTPLASLPSVWRIPIEANMDHRVETELYG
ncbi:MAG: hypothetical protein HYR58_07620 [Acidobacteria bacterium]|nr:hypothetical protein [Acidobacteriota bacterium]